ncbi:MAG: phosphotransferase [Acidimicrobiales bacterium]
MATHPIPATIDEVTAEWLSAVTGFELRSIRAEQIGVGIGVSSAVYRVRLEGSGCPDSVVVKLPALDPAAVFTSTMLRMYIREAAFFNQLAAQSPIRVPLCHHATVDEQTSSFVVVMEDLGGLRSVDQVKGMSLSDAERAVDEIAAWHAQWWGKAEELADAGITVSLGDPIYTAVLPMVFAEGWEKVSAAMPVAPSIAEVAPRFGTGLASLLASLAASPTTVLHGDYRADNMLFAPDGTVALLDFQLIGTGSGSYDLAYFLTQSIESELAHEHEQALFARWLEGLRHGGVPEADLAGLWDQYRAAALFCLVYPIVASRGMDLSDPRQYELVDCMNSRLARAVEDLDLAELI